MQRLAECVSIPVSDVRELARFAVENHVDLAVVGPEAPLALGVSDEFMRVGIPVFGPTKAAASIETSKVWAKQFMSRHRIPTADYSIFTDVDAARRYVRVHGAPVVVKADGLAAGKGVVVAHTQDEAEQAVDTVSHLAEGGEIIVEDCLVGREASFLVITDGMSAVPLISAKDHKLSLIHIYTLAARILVEEHSLMVECINAVLAGRVRRDGRKVIMYGG